MTTTRSMPSPEAEKVRELLYSAFMFAGPDGTVQAAAGSRLLADVIEAIYRPTPETAHISRLRGRKAEQRGAQAPPEREGHDA